jgi:hypothetical protein
VSGTQAVGGAAGDRGGWPVRLGRYDSQSLIFYFSRHHSMVA